MERINIGVIGVGGICQYVHLPGLAICKDVKIMALCDANAGLAEKVSQEYDVPRHCRDWRELLAMEEIHGVIIATPNNLHYPIAMAAMKAGKHVLLEKPIAMNASEAKKLCETAKKTKIVNMVAFNYRLMPAARYLRKIIKDGLLGEIRHMRGFYLQQWTSGAYSWRTDKKQSGTGELGDVGSHLTDFARIFVGEIGMVAGYTKIFLKERKDESSGKMKKVDVDDAAGFLVEFKNGATGVFEVSRFAPGRGCGKNEHQEIEINGSKGSAIFSLQEPEKLRLSIGEPLTGNAAFVEFPVPDEFKKAPGSPRLIPARDPLAEPRYDQAFIFTEGIRNHCAVKPDFYDGMKVQQVIDKVVESARSKKWETIPALS